MRAAAKLGIGLSLLAAVIGIRLLTVSPRGVESDIEELERLDAELASASAATNSSLPEAGPARDDSIVSSLRADIEERLPSFASRSRDGDKLVSCRLDGGTHFMRADDCAMRGGRSTVVPDDR